MSRPDSGRGPRIAILGSGTGSVADRVMAAAGTTIRAQVVLAISNNSRSGVMAFARDHEVPTLHLSGATHADPVDLDVVMADALGSVQADLVVLAGYMKKVGTKTLERWSGRIVNTHPALLPAYGGQGMYGDRVHRAVLADGATTTGASIHLVTAGYDEGPVVAQAVVSVEPDDDVASLRDRVQAAEKNLLIDWLADYCRTPSPALIAADSAESETAPAAFVPR